jgi:hypothetical protein
VAGSTPKRVGRGGGQKGSFGWGNRILAVMLLAGGLGFLAWGVVDYANGSGDAASEGAQAAASIFAGVFGLFLIALGALAWLKGRPLRAGHYSVTASPSELHRGGRVDAAVRVQDPAKVGEGAEVGLVCREYYSVTKHTKNSTYRDDEDRVVFEEWHALSPAQPLIHEAFTVPADAPYSHDGTYLSYHWCVTARERRELRPDSRTEASVWVLP